VINYNIPAVTSTRSIVKTSTKGTMDPGVCATVATVAHCKHAELTSGHALAVAAAACTSGSMLIN